MLCLSERKSCENSSVLRVFIDFPGIIASMGADGWRFSIILKLSFCNKREGGKE